MPTITIVCGVLLSLVGILGYAYGLSNGNASLTALIPFVFGTLLEILGALALARESLRKHMLHAAVIVALFGFIATGGRVLMKISDLSMSAAVIAQVAMAVICLVFVLIAIKSFIDARKNR